MSKPVGGRTEQSQNSYTSDTLAIQLIFPNVLIKVGFLDHNKHLEINCIAGILALFSSSIQTHIIHPAKSNFLSGMDATMQVCNVPGVSSPLLFRPICYLCTCANACAKFELVQFDAENKYRLRKSRNDNEEENR